MRKGIVIIGVLVGCVVMIGLLAMTTQGAYADEDPPIPVGTPVMGGNGEPVDGSFNPNDMGFVSVDAPVMGGNGEPMDGGFNPHDTGLFDVSAPVMGDDQK